jgi:hypothetical protein
MKPSYFLIYASIILTSFAKCNNKPVNQTSISNGDSVRKIIVDIINQMSAAQGDTLHGPEKYISFCTDTIIANYDGDFSTSPYKVSHDLANGITESPHEFTFLLYDKTAIISFLKTSYELINTDTLYHHLRITETFVYDQDKWKMAGVFDALQPVNYFKPIAEKNANLYSSFAGVYQWKPGLADTLFVKDGKLFGVSTGEEPELNFPINDSEYMIKSDLGKIVFNKDRNGKVIAYTYMKYDGQKVHAIKIK